MTLVKAKQHQHKHDGCGDILEVPCVLVVLMC
jgi:hypothetical protein